MGELKCTESLRANFGFACGFFCSALGRVLVLFALMEAVLAERMKSVCRVGRVGSVGAQGMHRMREKDEWGWRGIARNGGMEYQTGTFHRRLHEFQLPTGMKTLIWGRKRKISG